MVNPLSVIAGLLMVAVGGFWFVPATYINGLAHAGRLSPAARIAPA